MATALFIQVPVLKIMPEIVGSADAYNHWERIIKGYLAAAEACRKETDPAIDKLTILLCFLSPEIYALIQREDEFEGVLELLQSLYLKKKNLVDDSVESLNSLRNSGSSYCLDHYCPKMSRERPSSRPVVPIFQCDITCKLCKIAGRQLSGPRSTKENTDWTVPWCSLCWHEHILGLCSGRVNTCDECGLEKNYCRYCKSSVVQDAVGNRSSITSVAGAHIIVTIGEKWFLAVLDSGAGFNNFIDRGVAVRLGLPIVLHDWIVGLAVENQCARVCGSVCISIAVKGRKYHKLRFLVLQNMSVDIILGLHFFNQHSEITFRFDNSHPPLTVLTTVASMFDRTRKATSVTQFGYCYQMVQDTAGKTVNENVHEREWTRPRAYITEKPRETENV